MPDAASASEDTVVAPAHDPANGLGSGAGPGAGDAGPGAAAKHAAGQSPHSSTHSSTHSSSSSSSLRNYHPETSRRLSREDASSLIGGISVSPALKPRSPTLAATKTLSKISIPEVILSDDDEHELHTGIDHHVVNANGVNGVKAINGGDAISVRSDETQKVFNFSFPFSSNLDDESETASESKQLADRVALEPDDEDRAEATPPPAVPSSSGVQQAHRPGHSPGHALARTLRRISRVFNPRRQQIQLKHPVVLPNPAVIITKGKRPSHPMCPNPPPNVRVYWDDIANVSVPDEIVDRENIRHKLERQLSLDTLEEARYYRDTSHLDDGKMKALRESILPRTPSLNVKLRTRADSPSVGDDRSQAQAQAQAQALALTPAPVPAAASVDDVAPAAQQQQNGREVKAKDTIAPTATATATPARLLSSLPMSPVASLFQHTLNSSYDIYDELDGDVLVIGGYRGSILRDSKTKRRTWIPVLKAGLNIKKINLELGPSDEDELREFHALDIINDGSVDVDDPAYPKMYPDGMLTHIGPVDISRRLIKKLNSNPNVRALDWGYDWRLSPELIAQQLHEHLKEMKRQKMANGTWNGRGVLLIAHSMGGIVAHGAMIKDPELVRGIIYAGTPLPCANILGPIRYTDSILLSKDILTNQANFFMRSSYVFVPPSWGGEDATGKNGGMTLFRDLRTGKRYKIDFWEPTNWILYNLSPLVSNVRLKLDVASGALNLKHVKDSDLRHTLKKFLKVKIDPQTENIVTDELNRLHEPVVSFIDSYTYLTRTLRRTKKFIKSLEYDAGVQYPPLAQVFSNGVPSVKYSLVDGEECIKRGEYYRFFYGPGDGVVYQGWNFPRERGRKRENRREETEKGHDWRGREYGYGERYAYPLCGRFRCTTGHIGLLGDLEVIGQAISAILDEEVSREEQRREATGSFVHKDDYAEDE